MPPPPRIEPIDMPQELRQAEVEHRLGVVDVEADLVADALGEQLAEPQLVEDLRIGTSPNSGRRGSRSARTMLNASPVGPSRRRRA